MSKSKEYAVCEFTIVGSGLENVYNNGKIVRSKLPTIIEFAAVKFNDSEITEQFHTFAQIDGIEHGALEIDECPELRGVTPSMLIGAPALESALIEFHKFTKGISLILRNESPRYEPLKNLRRCGRRYGLRFNNPVIRISDITSAAEVLTLYRKTAVFDVLRIAAKMRKDCEWKCVFDEYQVPFGRDDCLGYALAFAELIIKLRKQIDLPF